MNIFIQEKVILSQKQRENVLYLYLIINNICIILDENITTNYQIITANKLIKSP